MKQVLTQTIDTEAFFWQPKNPRSVTSVHISQPTPLEERNLGRLFSIIEISKEESKNFEKVVHSLEEALEVDYYGTNEVDPSKGFEKSLQQVNQKISAFCSEIGVEWLKDLSIAAGVVYGKKVFFAQAGEIHAYLIHQDKIIDVLEKSGKSEITNPQKTFSNILSGDIEDENSFVLCSCTLLDYLSLEKLKRIVNDSKTPKAACENLHDLLATDNHETTFATVVIKSVKRQQEETTSPYHHKTAATGPYPYTAHPEEDSMHQLITQEQRTNELLTPSIWPNLREILKSFRKNPTKKEPEKIMEKSGDMILEEKTPQKTNTLPPGVEKGAKFLLTILAAFFHKIGSILAPVFRSVRGSERQKKIITSIKNLPYKTNKGISKGIVRFKGLNQKRKILLVGSLLLIIIFSWSISKFGARKEMQKDLTQYREQLKIASEKQVSAESNIIFNNEITARKLLAEASALVAGIPANITEIQGEVQNVKQKIDATSRQVNHIVTIDNPELLADLTTVSADIAAQKITGSAKELFVFTKNNDLIEVVDIENKKITPINPESGLTSPTMDISSLDGDTLLRLHEDKTLSTFSVGKKSVTATSLEISPDNKELKDINIFNKKLYVLDSGANQIFRYTVNKDKYSPAGSWIKEASLDIKDALSMGIDGSIYILKGDGSIIKLFNGQKDQNWKGATPEPALSSATELITSADIQNLYITDPNNKRVVVIAKDGKLVNQYTSEKFDNMKGISVDEKGKKMYVLNGEQVYTVNF